MNATHHDDDRVAARNNGHSAGQDAGRRGRTAADVPTNAPTVTTDPRRDTRSAWGRSSRVGGGSGRLIGVSLTVGAVAALALGAVAWITTAGAGHADFLAWLAAGAMAFNGLVFGFLLAWLALVDQSTIRGAARNREESIEGRWYDRAASGAFHDTLVIVGLGTAILSFGGHVISPALTGGALFVLMGLSVAVRYLLQKRRG